MNYIDELRQRGLNADQIDEVKEGLQHGLTTDQCDIFAKPEYDFMQMQEIRKALENGLSEKEMSVFLDEKIDYQAMEHARLQLEDHNAINEKAHAEVQRKKATNLLLKIIILVIVIGGMIGGYFFRNYWNSKNQTLEIEFIQDDEEPIKVEYGTTFIPMNYIKDYSKGEDITLVLPEEVDTTTIGKQTLIFTISNAVKSITKELEIEVVDDIAPTITLNTKEVTLTRGEDKFSYKEYLSSATDNVDGDLTESVTASKSNSKKDSNTITYSVIDANGNEGTAKLKINWVDPKPTPTPIVVEKPVYIGGGSNSSSSSSSNSGTSNYSNSNSSSNYSNNSGNTTTTTTTEKAHGSSSYYSSDMDADYGACVAAMNSMGYGSCTPTENADGVYTGYIFSY